MLLRRVFRPRVLVYSTILLLLVAALVGGLVLRSPFKVDVVRDRGTLARLVEGGKLENVYRLQLMNATESEQIYRIAVDGLPGLTLATRAEVVVQPAEARWVAVRVHIQDGSAVPGSHPISFVIHAGESDARVVEKSVFVVPR